MSVMKTIEDRIHDHPGHMNTSMINCCANQRYNPHPMRNDDPDAFCNTMVTYHDRNQPRIVIIKINIANIVHHCLADSLDE